MYIAERNSYPPPLQDIIAMSDLSYSGAVLVWGWRVMMSCLQRYAHWHSTCMILTKAHQRPPDGTVHAWYWPKHTKDRQIRWSQQRHTKQKKKRRTLPVRHPVYVCSWLSRDYVHTRMKSYDALSAMLCSLVHYICMMLAKAHQRLSSILVNGVVLDKGANQVHLN